MLLVKESCATGGHVWEICCFRIISIERTNAMYSASQVDAATTVCSSEAGLSEHRQLQSPLLATWRKDSASRHQKGGSLHGTIWKCAGQSQMQWVSLPRITATFRSRRNAWMFTHTSD